MKRRKSYWVSGFILATVALIISLLGLEGYVRFFWGDKIDTEILRQHLDETSIKSLIQPSDNPDIYFELRPNLKTYFRESLVVTSSEGYRIPEKPINTPTDAMRIAVLGDSTSFGWRVNYMDTYPEKYRQQMEADLEIPIDLRNYSVPGYNSKQELHLFLNKVLAYRPDLLILHHDHNDAQATGVGYAPNYIAPEYGDNILNSALLKFTLRQIREFQNQNNLTFHEDQHTYFDGYIVSGPLYDDHLLALQTLADQAKLSDIPVVIILFNTFVWAEEVYEESERYIVLHKDLSVQLEQMGFYVLDLYPHYQTRMKEVGWSDLSEGWISRDPMDAHPNPGGHQFIADTLVKYTYNQPDLIEIFREPKKQ